MVILGNDDEDEDEDEGNQDMIMDTWGEGVITAENNNMETNDADNQNNPVVTQEKLAETVHKGRALIRTVRHSSALTRFVDNQKKTRGH